MTKYKQLSEVMEIRSGYTFRGAVQNTEVGVAIVQAKDVDGLYLNYSKLSRSSQNIADSKFLVTGDVLLTTRGSFRACVVDFNEKVVATSALHILRLKTDQYLPEFIALYLNSPQTQSYLKQSAKGATIQSISIADLGAIKVPVVPLDDQKLLLGLQQSVEQQAKLLESKTSIINKVYNNTITKYLQGAIA